MLDDVGLGQRNTAGKRHTGIDSLSGQYPQYKTR